MSIVSALSRAIVESASCQTLALSMACAFVSVSSLACGDREPAAKRVQRAGPGPGDSLAKLTRRMLEADDPVAAMQDYMCEIDRLIRLYDAAKTMDIQEIVEDTTYKPEDDSARRRVESALAHRILRSDCPGEDQAIKPDAGDSASSSIEAPVKQGPGDSLAKLSRVILTDSNPRAIAQAMVCENVRLIRLYGGEKAAKITAEVRDTIYRSTDEAAFRRVDAILANNVFDLSCGYPPGKYPKPAESDSLR